MKTNYAQLGRDMMLLGTYEDYDVPTIIEVLKAADDMYFNEQESFITDDEYDALKQYATMTDPNYNYFTGVGSDVRGGKVKLPHQMGSLDQVQIGDIVDWVGNWRLQTQHMIITDKLDGTSGMVIYDNAGDLQIAYSRGNGIEGADITRHVRKLPSVPMNVEKKMDVRGEMIIRVDRFPTAQLTAASRSGTPYKNARNMVAGLMNAKTNVDAIYQYVDFVAYEILGYEGSKVDMLCDLRDAGFLTPYWTGVMGEELNDSFLAGYLNARRHVTSYEIDGVVIDVDSAMKRSDMNPTKDTLNPAFAIKYKVADASNLAQTEVVSVHWAVSKHGYLKPRVEIQPVELMGATITFCTGFNAKFIVDNNIGPGAVIEVTRSGDVIPFIKRTVTGATAQLPTAPFTWITNDNGEQVDIIVDNHEDNRDVQINRLVDFFSKIDAPYLKNGGVTKLYEAGHDTISNIIQMTNFEMVKVIGENGNKIYDGLRKALTDIPLYKLLGAFSNERGIGVRRMKKLQQALGRDELYKCDNYIKIEAQDGFDEKTAKQVMRVLNAFNEWFVDNDQFITLAEDEDTSNGSMVDQKVVFTGFRDKALGQEVENAGGHLQSTVSSKTTLVVTTDPNGTSGKLKKARNMGIMIVGIDELRDML